MSANPLLGEPPPVYLLRLEEFCDGYISSTSLILIQQYLSMFTTIVEELDLSSGKLR